MHIHHMFSPYNFHRLLPTSTLSWYKHLHNIDSACVKRHVFDNRAENKTKAIKSDQKRSIYR